MAALSVMTKVEQSVGQLAFHSAATKAGLWAEKMAGCLAGSMVDPSAVMWAASMAASMAALTAAQLVRCWADQSVDLLADY